MDELQMLLQHLRQPEYVHVLLNPLPVYALAMGVLALGIALLMRSRQAQVVALIVVIAGCASAYPVLRYGQRGYDRVYAMSNSDAQQWLDLHMQRAERFVYAFYVTGLLAAAALVALWKFPKAATPLAVVAFLMAAASIGIGGWISHAGGQVRHSEFRGKPPAATAPAAYTCPMHPEVVSDKPGDCPKCGMHLVPKKSNPTPKHSHEH